MSYNINLNMLYETSDPYLCQGEGPLTYAGRIRAQANRAVRSLFGLRECV
jgi:hypothetical protein